MTGGNHTFVAERRETASLLEYTGAWPWFILGAALLALALFCVLDIPFRRRRAVSPTGTGADGWVAFFPTAEMAAPLDDRRDRIEVPGGAPSSRPRTTTPCWYPGVHERRRIQRPAGVPAGKPMPH
jgi:hypothetical protein